MMVTGTPEAAVQTLEMTNAKEISAPIDVVFETLLEQLGPLMETSPGSPLAMTLEAWPGGRWYRDLGDNTGHLWGFVQVIKPPTLLEITGPLFMSYPAVSHVQWRLTAEGRITRLSLLHRAIGQITPQHREGVGQGWRQILAHIRERAEATRTGSASSAGAPRT